jgi:hypothetical protein
MRLEKSLKKGKSMEIQKVLLQMPKDLHYRLKVQAVIEQKTLSEVINAAVEEALAKREGGKKK